MAEKLQLQLRASMEPSSLDEDSRAVDVTWTTGARVRRSSWDGDYDEELSTDPAHVRMGRLNSGAPLLANHDGGNLNSVIGVVESARMENGKGVARVRFAKDDPAAESVFNKVKQGVIRNVSVGYRVHKAVKVVPDEGPGTNSSAPPVYRAIDWEPYEISAVPMGADSGAGFRSLIQESTTMDEVQKKAADELKKQETEAANLRAEVAKLTRERDEHTIRSLATRHGLGDAFAEKLIKAATPVDAARAAVLDELAARSAKTEVQPAHDGRIEVGREDREKFFRAALASMIHKFNMTDLVEKCQKSAPARVRRFFEDVDLKEVDFQIAESRQVDLARAFLARGGQKAKDFETSDSLMKRALTFRSGGENTTSDYTLLLENLMHKQMLGNYLLADDTWSKFCKADVVSDFRPHNRYRTGSFGALPLLPEGEEYTHASVPDGAKYQISAQTYGRVIKVSRQALINDDIAGIMDTMAKYGRSAALSLEIAVYALLNSNSGLGPSVTYNGNTADLFDASWGNVGTGAALSVQSVDADRTLLASQKDISGNEYLDLARPGTPILLVPLVLRGQAMNINKSQWDVSQSSKFEVPNIVQGLFREVVASPRLNSLTRRYIFADPGDAAAIVVAFLNGERAPFMETRLGWTIDGTEMKIRLDYGVQAGDPKGAVTNAGA